MKQRKLTFSSPEKRSFSRKAQGLPITTIIIAALGIIVLVIVAAMLYQRTTVFGKGLRNVSEQVCSPPNVKAPIGTDCETIYGSFKDLAPDELCCKAGSVK